MTGKYLKIYWWSWSYHSGIPTTSYHDKGLRRNLMYIRQNIIALRLKKHYKHHNHSKALPLQPLHLYHNQNPHLWKSMSPPITGMKKTIPAHKDKHHMIKKLWVNLTQGWKKPSQLFKPHCFNYTGTSSNVSANRSFNTSESNCFLCSHGITHLIVVF